LLLDYIAGLTTHLNGTKHIKLDNGYMHYAILHLVNSQYSSTAQVSQCQCQTIQDCAAVKRRWRWQNKTHATYTPAPAYQHSHFTGWKPFQ